MYTYFKENRLIWLSYMSFIVVGLAVGLSIEKGQETLFLQSMRNTFWDWVFYGITLVFEFPYLLLTVVVLLVVSLRLSTLVFISYVGSSIITQVVKRILEWPRPVRFFEAQGVELDSLVRYFEGHLPCCNSFPSGHTTVAFTICFTLLLSIQSQVLKWIFFMLAVFIAVSRVYLAVHFTEDVLAGSFVGVVVALGCSTYALPRLEFVPKAGVFLLLRKRR